MTIDLPSPERQPVLNIPMSIVAVLSFCIGLHLIRAYILGSDMNFAVLLHGAFIPIRYADGFSWEWLTTPISYSLLHGGFGHLANNAVWLVAFGSPIARSMSNVRFALFWICCSSAAALFHYLADPSSLVPMIGASGAVSGMMGAAARSGFRLRADTQADSRRLILPPVTLLLRSRQVMGFLGIYLFINIGIGLAGTTGSEGVASIAWQAHIGGLIAGFVLLPLFLRQPVR